VESIGYGRNWSFAERTISAPITPMKSARWEPNWSFANPQGSWFKGGGSRNGSGGDGVCVVRRSIRHAMAYPGFRRRQLAWVLCRRALWHSGFPQACWQVPTRAFGRNHWRQIAHGLFRVSGMVMLHGHHAPGTDGSRVRSECLGQFWKAGNVSQAPKHGTSARATPLRKTRCLLRC
jgi:hypothetical protein